jgi:hypothetical protein
MHATKLNTFSGNTEVLRSAPLYQRKLGQRAWQLLRLNTSAIFFIKSLSISCLLHAYLFR